MAQNHRHRRSILGRLLWRLAAPRSDAPPAGQPGGPALLSRSDQQAIALFAALAFVFMAASWLASGGPGGGLVDIDAVEPLEASFQTDINSADWTELMQLPEIGETLAKRIVASREQKGPFPSHDDVIRVRGIGPKTLEKIRPYLRPAE